VSGASNRFSSGSLPGFGTEVGFTSVDAIVPRFGSPWWDSKNTIFGKRGPHYTDEAPLQQVASVKFFSGFGLLAAAPAGRLDPPRRSLPLKLYLFRYPST
jgi:hypothetical protein